MSDPWCVSGARDAPLGWTVVWWPLITGLADRRAGEAWLRANWRGCAGLVHFSVHAGPASGTRETADCWEHWDLCRSGDDGELELRSGRNGREI